MQKMDLDTSPGAKLLGLFQKLMLDGRRHYQANLAEEFNCSRQTVMRMVADIEAVVGTSLETGMDRHRRWYQIRSYSHRSLGLDFEELRYLSICRDLATPYLSEEVKNRVDDSILNLSMLLADQEYAEREKVQKQQFGFSTKGRIDYSPHFGHIESLIKAGEHKLVCLVQYKAAGADCPKEHRFAPSRIISMNNALYALGADTEDDFRGMRHLTNLAIHRIIDITVVLVK